MHTADRSRLPELKRALYLCFSAFGRVLDVVCLKTAKLRGQAWVVFADVPAATSALRGMQGFNFYDRPLVRAATQAQARRESLMASSQRIAFAHGKSDVLAKADGSWLPPDKRVKGPQQGAHRRSLALR